MSEAAAGGGPPAAISGESTTKSVDQVPSLLDKYAEIPSTFANLERALTEISEACYGSFGAKDYAAFDASFCELLYALGVIIDQCFPLDDDFTPVTGGDYHSHMGHWEHWLTIVDNFCDCLSRLEAADAALLEEMKGLVAQQRFEELEACRGRLVVDAAFTKHFKALLGEAVLPALATLRAKMEAKKEAIGAAERAFQMRRPFPRAAQLSQTSLERCRERLADCDKGHESLLNDAMRFVCSNLSSAAAAGAQCVAFANFNDRWTSTPSTPRPDQFSTQYVRVLRDSWDGKSSTLLNFGELWAKEAAAFLAHALPPAPSPSPPSSPAVQPVPLQFVCVNNWPLASAELAALVAKVSSMLAEMEEMNLKPAYHPALLAVLADPVLRALLIHRLISLGYAAGSCQQGGQVPTGYKGCPESYLKHLQSQSWLVVNLWSARGRATEPASLATWMKAYLHAPMRFPTYNHALIFPLDPATSRRIQYTDIPSLATAEEVVGSLWLNADRTDWCDPAAMGLGSGRSRHGRPPGQEEEEEEEE